MISTNEALPDIERLGRQEFILDTEEYQRMLSEEEKLINDVREEIEFTNLAVMFMREHVKRSCWDKMAVKGRTIKVRGPIVCCMPCVHTMVINVGISSSY